MLKNRNLLNIKVVQDNSSKLKEQVRIRGDENQLESEYQLMKRQIFKLMSSQTKPVQIRIKQWLRKFDAVVEVQQWQKNRNLYCRILHAMLLKKSLTTPFHKLPPDTPLPIISLYEVSFDIRAQLERQKSSTQTNLTINQLQNQKENRSQIGNMIDGGLKQHRSKQKYAIQNKLVHKQSLSAKSIDEGQNIEKDICIAVRKSYDFLIKNTQKFVNQSEVNELLSELWNFSALP